MPGPGVALAASNGDTALVERVRGVFADVLDRTDVAPDDDFFELGGSSMLAISLVLALEEETGRELPITALHEAPSPIAISRLLASDDPIDLSPVVRLRGGPPSPPLFMIAGLGGTVMEFASVARVVPADLAVYGLQAIGLDGEAPLARVGDMADAHVASIRAVQPTGPYFLAGYSFGGLLAFEVARRLVGRGEQVRFLGLIDAYPDGGFSWRALRAHLRAVASATGSSRRTALERASRHLAFRLRVRLGLRLTEPAPDERRLPPALLRVRAASNAARQDYRPTPCACDATFFHAVSRLDTFPKDPAAIWRGLVRQLTIVPVAGDHYSMLRAGTSSLAVALGHSLRHAAGQA